MDAGENAAALNRDPDEERYTGVFNLHYKRFAFTAEGVRRGIAYLWPPPPGAPDSGMESVSQEEESWVMEGRQGIDLGGKASLDAALSYLHNSFDAEGPPRRFRGDRLESRLDLN